MLRIRQQICRLIPTGKAGESGMVMILALITLALGSLMIVPTLNYMATGIKAVVINQEKTAELYSADAGVEHGIWKVQHDRPSSYPHSYQLSDVNGIPVNVTIEDIGAPTYRITSTAGRTTIEAYVTIPSGVTFGDFNLPYGEEWEDDIIATGDVTLNDTTEVRGNICAGGDITIVGHSEVEQADCICANDVYVNWGGSGGSGNAEIRNNIYARGDVLVGQYAQIESDIFTDGDVIDPWNNVLGNIYPYQECPCCPPGGVSNAVTVMSWQIN